MEWKVEYTDEFEAWWDSLDEEEQESVAAYVMLLEKRGASLPHPDSSGIRRSRHTHMRELRVPSIKVAPIAYFMRSTCGSPFCWPAVTRPGMTGWYERMVPVADNIYDEHLAALKKEGLIEDG